MSNLHQVWYRARRLVPGTTNARHAGCLCPFQPRAQVWLGAPQRTGYMKGTAQKAVLVNVSSDCPIHRDTPRGLTGSAAPPLP